MSAAVLRVLERIAKADNPAQALREAIDKEQGEQKRSNAARKAKRGLAPGRSKEERRADRNALTASVREAVWDRARLGETGFGRCECGCGCAIFKDTFHMDHFFGGKSRRESTTVDGCWALHPECDRNKTENIPSRQPWLIKFGDHCARHGYESQLKRTASALGLYRAQHPDRRTTEP